MPRWEIIDGPSRGDSGTADAELYVAMVRNAHDPARRRIVRVWLSRTALTSDPATLPDPVREAIETSALSAVEATLNDWQPPDNIYVSTNGIQGSTPGAGVT